MGQPADFGSTNTQARERAIHLRWYRDTSRRVDDSADQGVSVIIKRRGVRYRLQLRQWKLATGDAALLEHLGARHGLAV